MTYGIRGDFNLEFTRRIHRPPRRTRTRRKEEKKIRNGTHLYIETVLPSVLVILIIKIFRYKNATCDSYSDLFLRAFVRYADNR